MGSKKKLILAISSFSFVLVTAIVAVVAIFAAQNQGVQTTFRISYTAKNVAASVRANYTVGATTTAMLTDSGEDELVFLPEMAEGTGKLSPETDNIALEDETSVVLEYIFSNDSDTVDVAISLDTSAFVLDNMRVSYAYSYSRITNYATMPTDDSFEPMVILGKTDENGDYDTLYVYMKVEVDNLANDASFTGNILYNLDRATPVKLEFENVSTALNKVLMQARYIPSGTNIKDLPRPNLGDDVLYVWALDVSEGMMSYPLVASTDVVVYAIVAPYVETVDYGEWVTTKTIKNVSDKPIFIETSSGADFTYGGAGYIIPNNEYIILNPDQEVCVWESNDLAMARVVGGAPSDLEDRMFYSAYGEYPQTYVGNQLNEVLKSASLTPTGKTYRMGVTSSYTSTTPYAERLEEYAEYIYNGKKYVKVENSSTISDYNSNDPTSSDGHKKIPFSDGTYLVEGATYFFEVEPIVVRAMQKNQDGTFTVQSLKMLFDSPLANDTNLWEESNLRDYMNTVFLTDAMLEQYVVESEVKNNSLTSIKDGSGDSTTDKIWIASLEEFVTWGGYVFNENAVANHPWDGLDYTGEYDTSYFSYLEHSDMVMSVGSFYYWNGNVTYLFRTVTTDGSKNIWGFSNEPGDICTTYLYFTSGMVHAVFNVNV